MLDRLPPNSSPGQSNLAIAMLPDAVADALAFVIAEKDREFARMLEHCEARLRASYLDQQIKDRQEIDELKKAFNDAVKNLANGKDGAPGRDGERGEPGAQGDKGEPGDKGEAGAPGRDGKDGAQGLAGERGPAGLQGEKGEPGRDGLPGLPGRDGKDGAPGKDGSDGPGFDSWDVEYDGERTVTFICGTGERIQKRAITLPIQIHRGIYKDGKAYAKGDTVTWAGCQWLALIDTDTEPTSRSDAWIMTVQKGRDGKWRSNS